jgi:hypothetical protein
MDQIWKVASISKYHTCLKTSLMLSTRRPIWDKYNRVWIKVKISCNRITFNNLHRWRWSSHSQIIQWFRCSIRIMNRLCRSNSRTILSILLKIKCYHLLELKLFLALPTFNYRWWWTLKLALSIQLIRIPIYQRINKIREKGHKIIVLQWML